MVLKLEVKFFVASLAAKTTCNFLILIWLHSITYFDKATKAVKLAEKGRFLFKKIL